MRNTLILLAFICTTLMCSAQTLAEEKVVEGKMLFSKGSYENAISAYTQAIAFDSSYAQAWLERGRAHQEIKQTDKAIGDYTMCLVYDKKNVTAHMQRAGILMNKELYDNAIEDFTQIVGIDSNNANAYYMRATCHIALGRPANAIKDYTKAINKGKATQVVYFQRAKAQEDIGLAAEALADYNTAIGIMPNFEQAYLSRGVLLLTQRAYDKALKDFTFYIDKHNKEGKAYYYRAKAYERLNNKVLACKDYQKSIDLGFLNGKEKPAICQ